MLKNIQRNRRMRAVGKFPFSYSEMKAAVAIIIRAGQIAITFQLSSLFFTLRIRDHFIVVLWQRTGSACL
jgi:hypothetical protein